MRINLWSTVVVVTVLVGFLSGYSISTRTGVEPGYFEAAEAGAYGVAQATGAAEEISEEYQQYYRGLGEQ